jgi:hypothetical protein
VFLMEQNYRSTGHILAVANALIEHNVQRKPKSLWTEASGGELAVRYRAENEHDEAGFVAEEIERLVQAEGHRYRDVAVFYRTNAQSRVLEDLFMRIGIPYRVVGGVRFYARREIKDILAYLTVLVNPQDLVSARRVINTPKPRTTLTAVPPALVRSGRIELWLEGRTMFDLRRWIEEGTPGEMRDMSPFQRLCIPIAQSEIDSNPNIPLDWDDDPVNPIWSGG